MKERQNKRRKDKTTVKKVQETERSKLKGMLDGVEWVIPMAVLRSSLQG